MCLCLKGERGWGCFSLEFGGIFISATRHPLPAGGLRGLARLLPAAATNNIGNNNVFGKSFYYGAVVFWELRNSG